MIHGIYLHVILETAKCICCLSRVLRPSVLRCWRALLLLCVLPFCNLFPRTYIRRRLIPCYDSGPLHKHQIYIRPIVHFWQFGSSVEEKEVEGVI